MKHAIEALEEGVRGVERCKLQLAQAEVDLTKRRIELVNLLNAGPELVPQGPGR